MSLKIYSNKNEIRFVRAVAISIAFSELSVSPMYLQAERYVDRQLDRAEDALRQKQRKARKWYTAFVGNEKRVCINEFHLFLGAFIAGCALGIGSA